MTSLEELVKISKIVGEHSSKDVNRMINFKKVMFDLKLNVLPSNPPVLVQTCSGYNCICWKRGIKGICIPYNTCLRCYRSLNNLGYCRKCDKK